GPDGSDMNEPRVSDHAIQQGIGNVLRAGVLVAGGVTLMGGLLLLAQHGGDPAAFGTFRGEPPLLKSLTTIVRGALAFDGTALAQLGLVLLIATPVARVALTLVAFAIQKDRTYVVITAIVLALLVYGFVFGGA
ncbi:MAG TPA: DUF1634 domain-containing protein, partial [Vicinamibacterales bacterium]|nr:DUF1634 domain-containing protein [Vicinamibacterales bacterium]